MTEKFKSHQHHSNANFVPTKEHVLPSSDEKL